MTFPFACASLACLVAAAAPRAQSPAPALSVSEAFPALGGALAFDLAGRPGAPFVLDAAGAPAERVLPWGTLFLDVSAGLVRVASGALDAGGGAHLGLVVPNQLGLVGLELYVQAVELGGPGGARLSNAVALRVEAAPPSGANTPLSIAASPDGTKLYVAHENGSLSVLDPATGTLVRRLPVGPDAEDLPFHAVDVVFGPDGRHAFVTNAAAEFVTVIDAATDSIAARVSVPLSSRRVAFDFGATRTVYVTNDRDNVVLRLREGAPGSFSALAPLALAGRGPGALAVLPGGKLMVGQRATHEVEVLDPSLPPGAATVARTPLASIPNDIVVVGSVALVAGQTHGPDTNKVFELSLTNFAVTATRFANTGTDYVDLALAPPYLAVTCAGSGTVLVADAATRALLATLELAPAAGFAPTATPQQAAFVTTGVGGAPTALWAVDYFRESARPVALAGGPPFALGSELALAYSGAPRVPLVDLTALENGDWFFRSVQFFNGTALVPNPVTCASCHPDGASDGNLGGNQAPILFDAAATAPYGWNGNTSTLLHFTNAAFTSHTIFGGLPPAGSARLIADFVATIEPPPNPFLAAGGALSPAAQAGKLVFEGAANCVACHAAPAFIPLAPAPLTLPGGVGTGIAPVNVPTLLGLWTSAPYLHDGSAPTLSDVLAHNVADQHGTTSTLSAQQKADLVAYLMSL